MHRARERWRDGVTLTGVEGAPLRKVSSVPTQRVASKSREWGALLSKRRILTRYYRHGNFAGRNSTRLCLPNHREKVTH